MSLAAGTASEHRWSGARHPRRPFLPAVLMVGVVVPVLALDWLAVLHVVAPLRALGLAP
jgi:hypothetical protein